MNRQTTPRSQSGILSLILLLRICGLCLFRQRFQSISHIVTCDFLSLFSSVSWSNCPTRLRFDLDGNSSTAEFWGSKFWGVHLQAVFFLLQTFLTDPYQGTWRFNLHAFRTERIANLQGSFSGPSPFALCLHAL